MCCFSRPVRFVGATRIFARGDRDARQLLAYAMNVDFDEELAMVLPLPVPPAGPDDAVEFIDLERYGTFFDDLEAAFPPDYTAVPQAKARSSFGVAAKPKLVVHAVGLFEASFVPSRADFARLDPRFRLPEGVWEKLPLYDDWGFAVFRLKPRKAGLFGLGATRQRIHPMAFSFPRRDPQSLFFPTVHVHDGGTVPASAVFDHMLFCQVDGVLDATIPWDRSTSTLGAHVDVRESRGLIDGARPGRRLALWGPASNADVILRPPEGVRVEDLSGRGESHAFAVRATHAYFNGRLDDPMRRAWQVTAETKLGALARGLRDGLNELTAARRVEWRLTVLDDALPRHFVNGDRLWTGTTYMDGRAVAQARGPGRVAMTIFGDHVEPQEITLAFADLPNQAELDRIRSELRVLVERAVTN